MSDTTTKETIDKARTAMRILFDIAKESGLNVDAVAGDLHNSGESAESFYIGDYTFHFDEEKGFSVNYWPRIKGVADVDANMEKEWLYDIDPDRIISFTLPPKEKALRKGKGRKAKSKQLLELYDETGGKSNG